MTQHTQQCPSDLTESQRRTILTGNQHVLMFQVCQCNNTRATILVGTEDTGTRQRNLCWPESAGTLFAILQGGSVTHTSLGELRLTLVPGERRLRIG